DARNESSPLSGRAPARACPAADARWPAPGRRGVRSGLRRSGALHAHLQGRARADAGTVPRSECPGSRGRTSTVVTPERFGQGMAFDEYVAYAGTPENLAREAGSWLGPQRRDFSGLLRDWYGRARLHEAQAAAVRWLAAQANGPARILVISEEWSSDCRRDVPMLARLAEAGRMELRIFTRDGQRFSQSHK